MEEQFKPLIVLSHYLVVHLCSVPGLGFVQMCEININSKASTSSFADRKDPSILG